MSTPSDHLADLDDADRATAGLILDAFAPLTLDRQSPATTPEQDAETAALVASAFDPVTHTAPAPGADARTAELVVLPTPARRRRWPLLAAAAAVVVLASALVLGPTGSSPSWAATPRTPSASDVDAIGRACAAPLSRGLGDLQSSGAVSVDGSPVQAPAPDTAAPPTSLPPLLVLDVRGDVAFAVYQDATWTVTCVVTADGDGWRDQGVQVGPGAGTTQPGIVALGGSATVDGEQVTTVTGSVPVGTTRVTFRLDDGTEVEASVRGTTWAAWFPGDRSLDPSSIVVD